MPWGRVLEDLACPGCGWKDQVPMATLHRTNAEGEVRKVGLVCRCARCGEEYCAGPGGSYRPEVKREAEQVAVVPGRKREEPRVLRDRDMRGM